VKLSLFTPKPVALLDLYDAKEQPVRDAIKPKGLWVSCDGDDDWEAWCKAENFNIGKYHFRQTVTLRGNCLVGLDQAGPGLVLHLTSLFDIEQATKIYGKELYPGSRKWMDWVKLAEDYDGMIISPYIWAARLHHEIMWYYPWDCASGYLIRPTKVVEAMGEPIPIDWTQKLLTNSSEEA